ncbi:carbohydrate-binding protein [Puniceicoccaceae bacterium K14]|nr:carbohydrate-binding protein [Puniceicoccaceae bacterium K14]
MDKNSYIRGFVVAFLALLTANVYAQFAHPGIWHKKSDLDRMKHMVTAQEDPWYTSFNALKADAKSSYDYVVQKDPNNNNLSRENPREQRNEYESDSVAAYQLSLMWYITGDSRYAEKAIEILNAWSTLTNFYGGGTEPLSAGLYGAPLINAAEIIKNTYSGWAESDIQAFKDMLVYPGYSNTTVPQNDIDNDNVTFYWRTYMGDPSRHGNQGLLAWRTVMAIGIFLDNEIIYDRAFRYLTGQPSRPDDLPYTAGPVEIGEITAFCEFEESYENEKLTTIPDYGYDDQIQHYIYDNGQCQEAFRDQNHSNLGISAILEAAEMAWNQGDDIYSYLDNRILDGCEYLLRYNLSFEQGNPLEPTSFYQNHTRNGRWKGLKINPEIACGGGDSRGGNSIFAPRWELAVAHYDIRAGLGSEISWTTQTRDFAISQQGFEQSDGVHCPGWGGLSYRRPEGCAGDPIAGFDSNGLPDYSMNALPMTIQAVNYDFFSGDAEDRVYNDTTAGNAGGEYRTDENTDIQTCSEGGYNLFDLSDSEYVTYTVYVPGDGEYNISTRVAGIAAGGTLSVHFDGVDKTGSVEVPSSGGGQNWSDLEIANNVTLSQGVQAMRVFVGGVDGAFNLKEITVTLVDELDQTIDFPTLDIVEFGDPDFRLNATASSTLDVSYSSSDTSVAVISGQLVQIVGPGTAIITASQAGNGVFDPAVDVSQVLQVNPTGSSQLIEADTYIDQLGVQTETTTDVDGGINVANIDAGDFVEYTVPVPVAGTYQLQYRVASRSSGGALTTVVNGNEVDDIVFPATGGWQIWTTVETHTAIEFAEGDNTLRINADQGGWNINWFKLVLVSTLDGNPPAKSYQAIDFPVLDSTFEGNADYQLEATASSGLGITYSSSNSSVATVTNGILSVVNAGTTIISASQAGDSTYFAAPTVSRILVVEPEPTLLFQAEDYTSQSGMIVEITTDVGGGSNVGGAHIGDSLDYEVYIPRSGQYLLTYRLASAQGGGAFTISVDGTPAESFTFPTTNGWQNWVTLHSGNLVDIESGDRQIRIDVDDSAWNMNWFKLVYVGAIGDPNPGMVDQTITFSELPTLKASDAAYALDAISSSFLEIEYSSSDTSVATISNGAVQPVGAGTVTITASQPGDSVFNAAPYVSRQLVIEPVLFSLLVEAEDFTDMEGLQTENTQDVGGGLNVGFTDAGDYLEYLVDIPIAGNFNIDYRVAGRSDASFTLSIDGNELETVVFDATGNWQDWETDTTGADLYIPAGSQTIRIDVNGSRWNINWFKLVLVDPDTDGDTILDDIDTDDDNDGVLDTEDAFPLDATETADYDGDGVGDNADLDDDNDGVEDSEDVFPFDPTESGDNDVDGIGDNADLDDDNDGVLDTEDDLPFDPTETSDNDNDGIGDNADLDDDNDGVEDTVDSCPTAANSDQADINGDGYGDVCVDTGSTVSGLATLGYNPYVGAGTVIDPFVMVLDNPVIGENVTIKQGVTIGSEATIGNGSLVDQHTWLGNDIYIGLDVIVGQFIIIGNDTVLEDDVEVEQFSWIGEGSYIGARSELAQFTKAGDGFLVGEDSTLSMFGTFGDNVTIGDRVEIKHFAKLKDNISIGNDVAIDQFVKIGEGTVIGNGVTINMFARIGDNVTIADGAVIEGWAQIPDGATVD